MFKRGRGYQSDNDEEFSEEDEGKIEQEESQQQIVKPKIEEPMIRVEPPEPVNPNKRVRRPPKIFEISTEKKRTIKNSSNQPKIEDITVPQLNLGNEQEHYIDQGYYQRIANMREFEIRKQQLMQKKFSQVSEEPVDHSRLELSMDSLDYPKNIMYNSSFGNDRLTISPDSSHLSRMNLSPRAPTPQQMFGPGIAKVNLTGEELDNKLNNIKQNIKQNERKPNMEIQDTRNITPSPRSAFQSFRN